MLAAIAMTRLRNIFILLTLLSCSQKSKFESNESFPGNLHNEKISLIDSLGALEISVPNRYDTFFTWTHFSDCGKPCNEIKYRFQPKNLKVTKESGFVWKGEPKDSIDRLTISHSGWFEFRAVGDFYFINETHKTLLNELPKDPSTYKLGKDTIEKIGDRYFSIIEVDIFDSTENQFSRKVIGTTTIRANEIRFTYDLLTKKKDTLFDNFFDRSRKSIRSIRISNGS